MTKKPIRRIPSAGPSITQAEIDLVTEAVTKGWYEDRNMHMDQFIKELHDYTGAKYVLPVVNCTSAIHLALLALNIGKGDEVIVPDVTWAASACPIHYVNATPIFCDIEADNWCISPESFKKAITKRTKAVIPVDLYGNMPDMDHIRDIAADHDLPVIEDAAEALGATYDGHHAGTLGDIGVYSFNATKLAIAGQGGALVTDNQDIYEKTKQLRHHGMAEYQTKMFWCEDIGYNYLWTNIQAALALAQLRRIEDLVAMKRKAFHWYTDRLHTLDLQFNIEAPNVRNTYWITNAIIDKHYNVTKEQVIDEFKKHQIDSRPFFYPISSMPAYQRYVHGKDMTKTNPVCYDLSPRGISFPAAATLTEEEADYVCDIFTKFLKRKK
jgi:perosamine synthetase